MSQWQKSRPDRARAHLRSRAEGAVRRIRPAGAEGSLPDRDPLLRHRKHPIVLPLFHSSLLLIRSHLAGFLSLLEFLPLVPVPHPQCFLRLPVPVASS